MKFSEKSVRKLDDNDFIELFRIVTLEMWRRMIHNLELHTGKGKKKVRLERWYDPWICLFLGFPGLLLVQYLMKKRGRHNFKDLDLEKWK